MPLKIFVRIRMKGFSQFLVNGNDSAWRTIGKCSTSEGCFMDSIKQAGFFGTLWCFCWMMVLVFLSKRISPLQRKYFRGFGRFSARTDTTPGFEILK